MGAAYYPSFERAVKGYEPATAMSGKMIARQIEELDAVCTRLQVAPLSSFYSESAAEAFEKIGEEMPEGMHDKPVRWSEAKDALRTVNSLLELYRSNAAEQKVVKDLEDLRDILVVAVEHGTRFRSRIDI